MKIVFAAIVVCTFALASAVLPPVGLRPSQGDTAYQQTVNLANGNKWTVGAFDACQMIFGYVASSELIQCTDTGGHTLDIDAPDGNTLSVSLQGSGLTNFTCTGMPKPALVTQNVCIDTGHWSCVRLLLVK